ncbi:uncharacterized protein K444DRAFT_611188 [Hyaloscypha bicolor E]|uniref:Uncharacterized protein n=1 Tax=Hyaloscypha bicolor E TaxID=1095630 RepID=A0A2J6TG33_9HELO|nr:uncharacterized protein K444DRAFT_611188 [Hyaloscypha bicolor E]PMD61974.1 hypothetical protein K444DRAFT_611188 [Hyaloscypha bicolor E]
MPTEAPRKGCRLLVQCATSALCRWPHWQTVGHGARSRVTALCYCIVSVYRVVPSGIFVGRATRALRLVGMLRLLAMMIVGIVQ